MQGFQRALTGVLGPELQPGRPSRSGPNDLYPPPDGMFMGGGGGGGPRFAGGTFTYTTMRNPDGAQGGPPVDDIATYVPFSSYCFRSKGKPLLFFWEIITD